MLQLDTAHHLQFTTNDLIGQRIAVLGISGSGKTNTVATLAEELLPNLPLTICDIEGEYWGLKERFEILVAGRSEHADVPLAIENAAVLAETSIRRGIPIILDLSEYDQDEMQTILLAYFEHLWHLSASLKSPYEIIIEEAHEFVPQGQRTPLKTVLTRFSLRGRKRGIGVILASQRSAKVEKDLLTQANILFLHSVVHPTDLNVYKDLIPLPAKEVEAQARDLAPGEAFVVRGRSVDRVHIRKRHTFHAGATPTLNNEQPHLRMVDAALLEELRVMTARSLKEGGSDELSQTKKRLREAEATIAEQQTAINQLQQQINLLSKLSVQVINSAEGTLPSTLEIDQAIVNHLHTPNASIGHERVIESIVDTKAIEKAVIMPPLNEAKFNSLQQRFRQVPAFEKDVLQVLIEQRRSLSVQEIAAWLNKGEKSVQNNPPHHLLKLGFISRRRMGNSYQYQSQLVDYLQREFPGADLDQLQSRLLR